MRQQGKLTNWNDEKGFGFITPSSGGTRVFVHITAFLRGQRRPTVNEMVTYSVTHDRKQRLCAGKVLFQRGAKREAARSQGVVLALCLFSSFFALLSICAVAGLIPVPVVGFYAFMSTVSFFMYGLDKSAAQRGAWRTTEGTLHLAEVAGGWPRAWVRSCNPALVHCAHRLTVAYDRQGTAQRESPA